jgi:hypothetical protein
MSDTTPAAPAKKRPGLVATLTVIAGALSGVGSNCAAKAATPSEVSAVQLEIAGLRKDITSVLERLRTVEMVQEREKGRLEGEAQALERLRRGHR